MSQDNDETFFTLEIFKDFYMIDRSRWPPRISRLDEDERPLLERTWFTRIERERIPEARNDYKPDAMEEYNLLRAARFWPGEFFKDALIVTTLPVLQAILYRMIAPRDKKAKQLKKHGLYIARRKCQLFINEKAQDLSGTIAEEDFVNRFELMGNRMSWREYCSRVFFKIAKIKLKNTLEIVFTYNCTVDTCDDGHPIDVILKSESKFREEAIYHWLNMALTGRKIRRYEMMTETVARYRELLTGKDVLNDLRPYQIDIIESTFFFDFPELTKKLLQTVQQSNCSFWIDRLVPLECVKCESTRKKKARIMREGVHMMKKGGIGGADQFGMILSVLDASLEKIEEAHMVSRKILMEQVLLKSSDTEPSTSESSRRASSEEFRVDGAVENRGDLGEADGMAHEDVGPMVEVQAEDEEAGPVHRSKRKKLGFSGVVESLSYAEVVKGPEHFDTGAMVDVIGSKLKKLKMKEFGFVVIRRDPKEAGVVANIYFDDTNVEHSDVEPMVELEVKVEEEEAGPVHKSETQDSGVMLTESPADSPARSCTDSSFGFVGVVELRSYAQVVKGPERTDNGAMVEVEKAGPVHRSETEDSSVMLCTDSSTSSPTKSPTGSNLENRKIGHFGSDGVVENRGDPGEADGVAHEDELEQSDVGPLVAVQVEKEEAGSEEHVGSSGVVEVRSYAQVVANGKYDEKVKGPEHSDTGALVEVEEEFVGNEFSDDGNVEDPDQEQTDVGPMVELEVEVEQEEAGPVDISETRDSGVILCEDSPAISPARSRTVSLAYSTCTENSDLLYMDLGDDFDDDF